MVYAAFFKIRAFFNIQSTLYGGNILHRGYLLLLRPWTSSFALVRLSYRALEVDRRCPSLQAKSRGSGSGSGSARIRFGSGSNFPMRFE